MSNNSQPWIYRPSTDVLFILLPPFISLMVIFLFQDFFVEREVSVLAWVVLILLIDVAHVYSTLYRTYFDKEIFKKNKTVLLYIPLLAWVSSVMIYEMSPLFFWRLLAYLAVFHFIRQQYGFMRIYSRKNKHSKVFSLIDTLVIYAATVYPVIYWHTHAPRNFHWFVEGDFYYFQSEWFSQLTIGLYLWIVLVYIIKETFLSIRSKQFNIPKNLIIVGTLLSWYFGIVFFNGDLIFTTLNVVSHGIPYMALVWIYGKKKLNKEGQQTHNVTMKYFFSRYGIVLFLMVIFVLAYFEEALWDGLVWQEHGVVFPGTGFFPKVTSKDMLAFLIPTLSLPQISHYLIDGFIWKIQKDQYNWQKVTLEGE